MEYAIYVMNEDGKHEIPVHDGMTVMQALKEAGIRLDAPCGGRGICRKCQVMVATEAGLEFRMACETPVEPNMEILMVSPKDMVVSVSGSFEPWPIDAGARQGLGVAIDIGTTTLATRLCDLATGECLAVMGGSNPQIAYGADVISRISAVAEGGLLPQRDLVVDALDSLIDKLLAQASRQRDEIVDIVVAGNTTMQHLACGIDPTPIGVSPFEPQTLFMPDEPTARVQLFEGLPPARMVPCVAGYVGGDITSGMVAVRLLEKERPTLFLDLGTNGEMALGSKAGVVTCATAAGPVFEGANIRFGMPAYPSAISQVKRTGDQGFSIEVIGDVEAAGICGTGLVETVALMLEVGVIDETGCFADEDEMEPWAAAYVGEDDADEFFRLSDNVVVTQRDVRNLQLAKSAILSGIYVMLDALNLQVSDVAEVIIAGGFGEYLNLEAAGLVGLFPQALAPVAHAVGNSSLEGATAALVSAAATDALDVIARKCRYIELSTTSSFNSYFVENIAFDD